MPGTRNHWLNRFGLNQARVTNRVFVSFFKGFQDNSAPVGVAAFAIPPDFTVDFGSRNLPGEITVVNAIPNPELVFDEGRAIVSSMWPEIGVSARVIYTRGDNDREITATLGVPVRRVEAAAWLGSGLVSGASGLLLSNLVGLDAATLTFLVISSLAAALIGRLRSLWVTFFGGIAVGLAQSVLTPYSAVSSYRSSAPFVLAIVALLILSRHRVVSISRAVN